jgi:SPASM domain peptide maturase of grasp-with-spasm system
MRFYKRFSNCYLIKGYRNYTIYDISRKNVFAIDKTTFELLGKEIIEEEFLLKLPNNRFEELLENDIIFQCEMGDEILFPPLNTEWNSPFSIISSIIDWGMASHYDLREVINQLDSIGCKTLQLRFEVGINESVVISTLEYLIGKNIRSIELVVHFNDNLLNTITKEYEFITNVLAYGAFETSVKKYNSCQIILTQEMFLGSKQCGVVNPSYFVCNNDFFFESNNFNTCLNRKVCVDGMGNIKNCPSFSQSFGNIKNSTLQQAMEHPDFKKMWSITKDQIDVCKDCEFRHMCTDCRVYIKDPENIYSQPAKCTYNPYIAKWQGEEGYVPVEECGTYNRNNGGFVVNHKRVAKLNEQVWGE